LLRYADGIELVLARGMEEMRQSLEECPAHAVLLNAATPEAGWVLAQAVVGLAPGTPTVVCAVPKEPMVVDHPGVVGYLVKPVTQSHLEQALRSAGRPVRHVLLVDDDPDALDLFQTMLHVCDRTLRIEAAASGKEALATMRCNAPDLVLLDVVMPDMSGWQLVEAMARDDGLRHVPVFFVSAQDPLEQPPRSAFLLATVDDGLSLGRLLRCSLTLSGTLLEPDEWSHPAPR
ncbi:MAG: response regulator, partial [Anaerolineae bacterium]|nr:response regulator [Anaerolineae bacterium]